MNGLPYIQTAENIFYLENGPAYLDRPVGSSSTTTGSKNNARTEELVKKFIFKRDFLLAAGVVRVLLLASALNKNILKSYQFLFYND